MTGTRLIIRGCVRVFGRAGLAAEADVRPGSWTCPLGLGGTQDSRLALDRSTSFGWYPRSHKPNQNKYRPFNTQLSFHSVLHPPSPFLPTAHSATTLSALVAADPSSPLSPSLPRLGPPSPQHTQPSSTAHSTSTPQH